MNTLFLSQSDSLIAARPDFTKRQTSLAQQGVELTFNLISQSNHIIMTVKEAS